MYESDMYLPVKSFLEELGYEVKAEVLDVDVMAVKDDEIVIVEMKKTISMKLLYQGCNRQRLYDNVYLAIPYDSKMIRSKQYKEKLHLLRRLRLGLLLVRKSSVDVVLDPIEYTFRSNKKKYTKLIEEFKSRKTSLNIGGQTGKKVITAYREQAIIIARCLEKGLVTTKEIKVETEIEKTTNILYDNHYGWFKHISRGVYDLTSKGREELKEYKKLNL